MLRPIIFLCLFTSLSFFCSQQSYSQDRFYTQFYSQPLSLNPSLTGLINGSFRASGAYRQQWGPVIESAFTTFSASADIRLNTSKPAFPTDQFGIGLILFHDHLGRFDFNSNSIALTGAYHRFLAKDKSQVVSAGLYLGLEQRSTGYSTFTFQDQYDLENGFSLPTAENLPQNQLSFFDLGLGFNYSGTFGLDNKVFGGASLIHFNSPNISFYRNVPTDELTIETQAVLDQRISFHGGVSAPISSRSRLIPRVLFSKQGNYIALNTGINISYEINDFRESILTVGTAVRTVESFDQWDIDAIILLVGLERETFAVGLSYDAQLNDITNERVGQGTFEVTLSITPNYEDENLFCPKF